MKRVAAAGLVALALGGCATVPPGPGATQTPGQKADPWENWNRKVFAFNDAVDDAVLKPVAEGYRKVVPQFVRTGIGNVLGNIGDVWSTANHFLQGKVATGFEMGMRVLTNTVLGFGGVLDIATEARLPRRSEDFGQTLGKWGFGTGPYMVLPILGPSNVRDTGGLIVDRVVASPSKLAETDNGAYAVTGVEVVQTRSELLATTNLVGDVALDRYSFVRDAYLQRRLDQVYDGAPPEEKWDDEPDSAAAPAAGASAPAGAASASAGAASAPAAKEPQPPK
jgi:phospholipid-binding lipoprotein MlaA